MTWAKSPAPGSPLSIGIAGFSAETTAGPIAAAAATSGTMVSAGSTPAVAVTASGSPVLVSSAALAVQPAQEQIQPVPQFVLVPAFLVQRRQEFQDHPLEDIRIVGQLLQRRQWQLGGADRVGKWSSRAHANKTQLRPKLFHKKRGLS